MKISNCIQLVDDFFNKLCKEIDSTYFPNLKFYRDNKHCAESHYVIERFSNGVLVYDKLISILSKECNDSKENIDSIVSKYIL